MLKTEREKEASLQSLSEMFNWVSKDDLRKICDENNWSMEICIDKLINYGNREETPPMQMKYSNIVTQEGNIGENCAPEFPAKKPRSESNEIFAPEFYEICENIEKGYRILVLMRGAPGSGKSYLALKLIQQCALIKDGFTSKDFIFSADDFFYDYAGNYIYRPDRIDDAHNYNLNRLRKKAREGWSPLILDNTNLKLWEMKPALQIGVENGYLIRILEPNTPWKNSAFKLASRNVHNIPRPKIKRMLEAYEPTTVDDLLKMLTQTKYTVPLPQMRNYPVIVFKPRNTSSPPKEDEKEPIIIETDALNPLFSNAPKDRREQRTNRKGFNNEEPSTSSNSWLPYEEEASNFWYDYGRCSLIDKTTGRPTPTLTPTPSSSTEATSASASASASAFTSIAKASTTTNYSTNEKQYEAQIQTSNEEHKSGQTLLDILKENISSSKPEEKSTKKDPMEKLESAFIPHNIGCPNENTAFMILRQVYPNQEVSSLWDLFVKCDGNIDWAADVLLKEEEDNSNLLDGYDDPSKIPNNFLNICTCGQDENDPMAAGPVGSSQKETTVSFDLDDMNFPSTSAKPQRARAGRTTKNQPNKNQDAIEIKQEIENKIIFSEDQYPKGIRKFRKKFNPNVNSSSANTTVLNDDTKPTVVNVGIQKDYVDEDNDENDELQELSLGVELVSQLQEMFKNEYYLGEKVNNTLNTNIFIPKSLAKQLFMLWMESAYNQMEEANQQMVREDEYFARLLKNPQYENFMESPNNIHELLDKARIEFERYEEIQAQQSQEYNYPEDTNQQDLATKLTHMKLYEQFPYIPKETVIEVFAALHNDYAKTLQALGATKVESNLKYQGFPVNPSKPQNNEELALKSSPADNENEKKDKEKEKDKDKEKSPDSDVKVIFPKKQITSEEAKHIALREFEETRNMAAHHSQLKAECYEKAKEAMQKGNGGIAAYYSQIANYHKTKVHMFNNRAANCIMEVHKHTQNNPDLLDLHYLHVVEAVACLDIFLDQHITSLRVNGKSYKHLYVITGRGLHSIGGVSTIKNKVKQRLKERFLRWTEVNPGLLKIKLFASCRFTTDIPK